MKKINKFLALLLAVAAVLSLAACGSTASESESETESKSVTESTSDEGGEESQTSEVVYRTLDEIVESGTINIGVFSDKNPFGYVDENGEYQGYDVYFARRLGEDLGVEVNFVSTEAANRIEYLQTGKVDIILANFTVTEERAEEVDFALPYMSVALGVVSPDSNVITSLDDWNSEDEIIVISGTTAETYLTENYPDITLQKYDTYANAKNALENGNGVAWANDNTEVIAFALQNEGYTVGIPSLGSQDTIAPAVSKGNSTLLDWLNEEIEALGEEQFFHEDYEATLVDTYGLDYEESLVIEGGVVTTTETTAETTEVEGVELDKDAFDELIASGPVADDETIASSSWATAVKEAGVLRVGGTRTSYLFSQLDETDNSLRGFDAGIYQLLARYILGDETAYELTQVDSSTRESVLQSDQVDVVVATYSITEARQEVISFAGPYYTSQQAVLVAAGNTEITGIDSLAGKTVATQAGSTGPAILEEYAPDAIVQEFESDTEARTALEQGRVDAYVTDYTLLLNAIVKNPDAYEIVGDVFGPEDNYGIGLPLDSDGVEFVNEFLKSLIADGTWEELWHITLGDRTGIETAPETPVIE